MEKKKNLGWPAALAAAVAGGAFLLLRNPAQASPEIDIEI